MSHKKPIGPIKIDKATLANLKLNDPAIIDTARAYVEADVNVQPAVMKYAIEAQKDNFARVTVGTDLGGYYLILKKVHDIWVVILGGQDLPGKDAAEKYGLPAGWFTTEY